MNLRKCALMAGFSVLCTWALAQTGTGSSTAIMSEAGQPRGSIGVVFGIPNNQSAADAMTKLVVANVIDGSPADHAGIKPGDTINSLGGNILASADDFQKAIDSRTIGSTAKIGYLHQGQQREMLVTIGEWAKLFPDWYEKRAQQGDAEAQYWMAGIYWFGEGKPKDHSLAYQWYSKAAEHGLAVAQVALASLYLTGDGVQQDYVRAVEWYKKAAEQQDQDAEDNLGLIYANGQGVPQDYKQAVMWYTKAAEQGHARAQSHLGSMYYAGKGVAQNYTTAMRWYMKAAVQGYPFAQLFLGQMYANGQGVLKDLHQARDWYGKAAQQGNSEAKDALVKLDGAQASVAAGTSATDGQSRQSVMRAEENPGDIGRAGEYIMYRTFWIVCNKDDKRVATMQLVYDYSNYQQSKKVGIGSVIVRDAEGHNPHKLFSTEEAWKQTAESFNPLCGAPAPPKTVDPNERDPKDLLRSTIVKIDWYGSVLSHNGMFSFQGYRALVKDKKTGENISFMFGCSDQYRDCQMSVPTTHDCDDCGKYGVVLATESALTSFRSWNVLLEDHALYEESEDVEANFLVGNERTRVIRFLVRGSGRVEKQQ